MSPVLNYLSAYEITTLSAQPICVCFGGESEEPNVQPRNFDPETRTLRKRTAQDDMELEDTVENKIRGLAEAVLAEDEERREQDLVR